VTPDTEVGVIFQVVYDTPQGTVLLTVEGYTPGAAERGIKCQIGHRKPGESEQRSAPLSLEDAMQAKARAAVLDGESLYVRLVDSEGRDLSATKIDEARWPRDADPTTVKTVSYWIYAPREHPLPPTGLPGTEDGARET
jgi:hypothetical protein